MIPADRMEDPAQGPADGPATLRHRLQDRVLRALIGGLLRLPYRWRVPLCGWVLSRVIAPTVGGWLLGSVGAWGPGVLGFVLMGVLGVYTWNKLLAHPELPLAQTSAS